MKLTKMSVLQRGYLTTGASLRVIHGAGGGAELGSKIGEESNAPGNVDYKSPPAPTSFFYPPTLTLLHLLIFLHPA